MHVLPDATKMKRFSLGTYFEAKKSSEDGAESISDVETAYNHYKDRDYLSSLTILKNVEGDQEVSKIKTILLSKIMFKMERYHESAMILMRNIRDDDP